MTVLGRSREPPPPTVLNVEVTLPVRDVSAQLDLLSAVLGTRALYAVDEPPTMVGVVSIRGASALAFGWWRHRCQLRLSV